MWAFMCAQYVIILNNMYHRRIGFLVADLTLWVTNDGRQLLIFFLVERVFVKEKERERENIIMQAVM